MSKEHVNCGYVDAGRPIDTAGNRHIWRCECKSTACQKQVCEAPKNYFEEMYNSRITKEREEEVRFYDYHLN